MSSPSLAESSNWPPRVESVELLEDLLSEPTPLVIRTLARLDGDLLVLGVGGKMGPTLARMAVRAMQQAGVRRRVIGVARFSDPALESRLQAWGVKTIRADLLDPQQLANLPDAPFVVAMPAMKFGSSGLPSLTWAMNTFLPGMIAQRYRTSRIVAFSTGNVYPLTPVVQGGSREGDALAPVGEYAMSALGRERIYDHFSRTQNTPTAIIRLNYAVEMRYGVLVDLALRVLAGETIDLSMGAFNCIWQADANAMTLAALAHATSPAWVVNVAGPETMSVRQVCGELGRLLDRPVRFAGEERPDALLSNGQLGHRLFGYPRVGPEQLMAWTAAWLAEGQPLLGKPTKFEVRDGMF